VAMDTNQPTEENKLDGLYGKFLVRQERLSYIRLARRYQIRRKIEAPFPRSKRHVRSWNIYEHMHRNTVVMEREREENRSSIYHSIRP
jgi:hypothetical protein